MAEHSEYLGLVLDVLAENYQEGWSFHSEDNVHIFLHCTKAKKPPHLRIRKDNGMMEVLNGANFQVGDVSIGNRLTVEQFIGLVRDCAGTDMGEVLINPANHDSNNRTT